jgi:RNase P/RNase MRP subunit p29
MKALITLIGRKARVACRTEVEEIGLSGTVSFRGCAGTANAESAEDVCGMNDMF